MFSGCAQVSKVGRVLIRLADSPRFPHLPYLPDPPILSPLYLPGSANAVSMLPDGTSRYCLPSSM
jgi:hypothetical protein